MGTSNFETGVKVIKKPERSNEDMIDEAVRQLREQLRADGGQRAGGVSAEAVRELEASHGKHRDAIERAAMYRRASGPERTTD